MILAEFDGWDGQEVLSAMSGELVRQSLSWLSIFDSRVRTRWAALLRRVNSRRDELDWPLFRLEDLWREKIQARLSGEDAQVRRLQKLIAAHPLSGDATLEFSRVEEKIPAAIEPKTAVTVDADSGRIQPIGGRALRSVPLARLFEVLVRDGRVSFEQALFISFEIAGFEPTVHDSKIQNLVSRGRDVLGSPKALRTKDRWIFLDKDFGHPLSLQVTRAGLPLSTPAQARTKGDRLRNERSLAVLLKKAAEFNGRSVSRAELETILDIPKSTLNRYLTTWLKRKWLTRQGNGRLIKYTLTFFES
jgi:hypothetical protein